MLCSNNREEMIFVANPIMQKQLIDNYDAFMNNPKQMLTSMNIPFNPSNINNPKAMFEQLTGQKVPDEYANNPLGYLQAISGQNANPMINMFNTLMRRK